MKILNRDPGFNRSVRLSPGAARWNSPKRPAQFVSLLPGDVAAAGYCRTPVSLRAFTIIEIALCLGIIGFALVAIIGALPTGLNVQKLNREQTIIGSDATVWMDAIRSGAEGYDDLTNYVIAITNQWTIYTFNNGGPGPEWGGIGVPGKSGSDWYTVSGSSEPPFALTSGGAIIGLLSTPKWTAPFFGRSGTYQSNYMIAYVRAFSGAEVDKPPQNNATILSDAFIYRMIVENFPYAAVDTNAFCVDCPAATPPVGVNAQQWLAARTNTALAEWLLQTNAQDFRLRFRWPVLPNGEIPSYGQATFRQMAMGQMTNYLINNQPLYFVQPSVFGQISNAPGSQYRPTPQW